MSDTFPDLRNEEHQQAAARFSAAMIETRNALEQVRETRRNEWAAHRLHLEALVRRELAHREAEAAAQAISDLRKAMRSAVTP